MNDPLIESAKEIEALRAQAAEDGKNLFHASGVIIELREQLAAMTQERDEILEENAAIIDNREAMLAAYLAEQEPVAFILQRSKDSHKRLSWGREDSCESIPLFTAPPLPEPAPHEQKPQLGAGRGGQTSQCEVKSSSKSHVCAAPSSEEVLIIASRLRVIANAIADANYNELTMRIPAEPDRDADIVTMRAAALIELLAARVPDSERLDWIEAQHTLHRSVEFLYVVDGYEVEYLYDGNPVTKPFRGETLRAAIDVAIAAGEVKPT